jgi:hypothetical protein
VAVFHGPVRAPEGVDKKGVAKATLSFPGWKDGKVRPATVEVPVSQEDSKGPR